MEPMVVPRKLVLILREPQRALVSPLITNLCITGHLLAHYRRARHLDFPHRWDISGRRLKTKGPVNRQVSST